MALILDNAASISAPPDLTLFGDTDNLTVWYQPRVWGLWTLPSGKPAISLYIDEDEDLGYLQMIFAGQVDQTQYKDVYERLRSQGRNLLPVRYLGKNDSGQMGAKVTLLAALPSDARFTFSINGGQGGSMDNPVPLTISTNARGGNLLKNMLSTQDIGLLLDVAYVIRGTTSTFEADIEIDYDRTYTLLETHVSWSWWLWSGDIQSAWQNLTISGAVKVTIVGGTPDQKTMVYKWAEAMRDLFFKPELGNVTNPAHPDSGIIRTSLRYEQQNEHKVIKIEFREKEFTDAPDHAAAFTGKRQFLEVGESRSIGMLAQTFRLASFGGARMNADYVPAAIAKAIRMFPDDRNSAKGYFEGASGDDSE